MTDLGLLGKLIASIFTICGAMRLARFNVNVGEVKSIEFPFIRENKTSFVVNYVNPIELFAGKIKAFYERWSHS